MPRSRRRRNARLASQVVELGFAVPEVIAHRLNRIALAGSSPSARDLKEFHRIGAEKVSAFYESWNAMALAAWRAHWKLLKLFFSATAWASLWAPRSRRSRRMHVRRATVDVLASGLSPIHRRAVANAKRLRK